jgi:hypothetical protein
MGRLSQHRNDDWSTRIRHEVEREEVSEMAGDILFLSLRYPVKCRRETRPMIPFYAVSYY